MCFHKIFVAGSIPQGKVDVLSDIFQKITSNLFYYYCFCVKWNNAGFLQNGGFQAHFWNEFFQNVNF